MMTPHSTWQQLATLVREGNQDAARRLQDELAPQMVRLVRRTLRTWTDRSPLDRQILAEAQRTLDSNPEQRQRDSEEVVRLVTQRLCARLLQDQTAPFNPTRRLHDTVPG